MSAVSLEIKNNNKVCVVHYDTLKKCGDRDLPMWVERLRGQIKERVGAKEGLREDKNVGSGVGEGELSSKLQVMQNAALRTATGCTQDTNIQHLYDETLTLPIHEHLQLHASQYKQKTQHPSHPLHKHTTYFNTPRLKKHYF